MITWPQQLAGSELLMSCCSSQTQEMWSCLIPLTLFFCNSGMAHKVPLLLLVGHYAYRSFVFPYWLQQPKPTPLHVWVAACIFVVYNGILQVGPPVQQQRNEHPGMSWSHVSTILFCSKSLCRTKPALCCIGSLMLSPCQELLLLCREHSLCTAGTCKSHLHRLCLALSCGALVLLLMFSPI